MERIWKSIHTKWVKPGKMLEELYLEGITDVPEPEEYGKIEDWEEWDRKQNEEEKKDVLEEEEDDDKGVLFDLDDPEGKRWREGRDRDRAESLRIDRELAQKLEEERIEEEEAEKKKKEEEQKNVIVSGNVDSVENTENKEVFEEKK